ncbi:MAG: hypothetical protein KIT56_03660 [Gammaproteobacteria bacterium]|nr:hypothetical protein [Gammaproteobacteria bacterium]MCW5582972.1 hypothetical protein [Gammaproteobacteria bacterium]
MPYQGGARLPAERASKLGHLDVLKSELVNELVQKFEKTAIDQSEEEKFKRSWISFDSTDLPLRLVFSVDGSIQPVRSDQYPFRELCFVKTALLRLDAVAIEKLDKTSPHPLALKDLLSESALYHATVFPLKNISFEELNNYHAIRKIIYDSLKDPSLSGEPFETLKWLSYQKWQDQHLRSPSFQCPHCNEKIEGLPYDYDESNCEHCQKEVFLTDMLSFHLDMAEDTAPQDVPSAYMLIHETLLLFTGIRHFWNNKTLLEKCLFIKDGPLTLRGQYSKLVPNIRALFEFAKRNGINIHLFGQEKSGAFCDHLNLLARFAPAKTLFLPSNAYIRTEIKHSPEHTEEYGHRTNYGNKLFVKINDYHHMVLSIPTGDYVDSQSLDQLIGLQKILSTLPMLLSQKHEGALLPIELANGIASLSTYPSARILKVFAGLT